MKECLQQSSYAVLFATNCPLPFSAAGNLCEIIVINCPSQENEKSTDCRPELQMLSEESYVSEIYKFSKIMTIWSDLILFKEKRLR